MLPPAAGSNEEIVQNYERNVDFSLRTYRVGRFSSDIPTRTVATLIRPHG